MLLHPPDAATWAKFTVFMQAMWIIDETEARWNAIKLENPNLKYIEVFWGKGFEGSMDVAALAVAKLMGLSSIKPFDDGWAHMEAHQHAGDLTMQISAADVEAEDHLYQEMMKFSYHPG